MVVAGLTVVACQDQPAGPKLPNGPVFEISDGHTGGNPGFFFLAPIRRLSDDATVPNTGFNATLDPVIEVFECAGTSATGCVLPLGALKSRITKTTGNLLLNRLFVLPHFQEYFALWDTHDLGLRTDRTYRIQVSVGATVLGFADIDVVRTLKEATRVDRDDFVALLQNFVLPIRFWVGDNALCPGGGVCVSKTINLATGGGIELLAAGEDFKVDIPSGTTATFNGQTVADVTVNLETCEGIDLDLPTVGACLRLTTFFDATGEGELEFSRPLTISLCVLNSEIHDPDETRQEGLITLHQRDGSLVRALPHAAPNCGQIGANGWEWLKNLATRILAPKPAFAATRNALLHVGAGGESGVLGAKCTPPPDPAPGRVPGIMLTTTCPPNSPMLRSGPRGSPMATAAVPKTVSDFQFALPAKMDYVDPDDASRSAPPGTDLGTAVKVTDWDGAPVRGARVTFTEPVAGGEPIVLGTAFSDENGIAQIFWTIREGPNTALASGRGIAAQNNYPNATVKPFMPDISFPTNQQSPVALGTGRITFLATGVLERFSLDQQNLLEGSIGGQGIGRFNDNDGTPDPNGTSFDFQDAQTFTVGISGRLAQIKVPLVNLSNATIGVTMQIVAVNADGVPDETHSLGEVTIPAADISTNFDDVFNPALWATFDVTSLEIDVTSGEALAFIVRSVSPQSYLYNPEFSEGYSNGRGYRRNRALTADWSNNETDFGFQTFVIPN
jgi:hypothetical protein